VLKLNKQCSQWQRRTGNHSRVLVVLRSTTLVDEKVCTIKQNLHFMFQDI